MSGPFLQPGITTWHPFLQPAMPRGVASYSQGCHAGSILHRLSWLLAAATRVLTRLSAPSNVARSERVKGEPIRRYDIHFIVYLQNKLY